MACPSLLTQFRLLQALAAAPHTPVTGLVNAKENTPMTDLAADCRATSLSPPTTPIHDLPDNALDNFLNAYAKKHPMNFKIPDRAFEDSEMLDVVTMFIKENLTAQWGSMKQKINHSVKMKANISVLTKSLATSDHEVTMAHWARFAFLHSTFVSFQTVVEQSKATSATQDSTAVVENRDGDNDSPKTPGLDPATRENKEPDEVAVTDTMEKTRNWLSTDYWEFVDLLLCDVGQEAHAVGKMPLEREKIVKM
ncbi:hypothetical protein BD769DRAFT_1391340 [Suillus cothurnatus]|nr:hypothetical protein BD769DRAFT_1391340 [Suillus cothurnatus]